MSVVLVVPCYNEADRFRPEGLRSLLADSRVTLRLVDDGSRDRTWDVLQGFAAENPERVTAVTLGKNRGKAEAVRAGMSGVDAPFVGFIDADLSTSIEDTLALVDEAERTRRAAVIGSRVALSGRNILRDRRRHYSGRVFATAASLALDATIYDTQCGAKVFRNDDRFRAAIGQPFASRWAFDVELLGRLLFGDSRHPPLSQDEIVEVPLQRWEDVPGSKITAGDFVKTGIELGWIAWKIRRRARN